MKKIILIITLSIGLLFTACKEEDNKNDNVESEAFETVEIENDIDNSNSEIEESDDEAIIDLSNFSSVDIEGNSIDSSIFEDKVTLVNVWGTFCNPCVVEMPDLEKLHENYKDDNFQVIGIIGDTYTESEENISDAEKIIEKLGITYTNIIPNDELIEEVMMKIQFFPTTFLVDEEGKIIGEFVYGAKDYNFFETWINSTKEI